MTTRHHIEIEYCTGCRWLIRAAWVAQELLSTFEQELGRVALVPGSTGGIVEIHDRGRFPEIKELKQLVRDAVAPERDLGHVDH